MTKKIISAYAPAPKPWENRVLETLKHVVKSSLGEELKNPREDFFLGQGILAEDVEEKIVKEMKDNNCDGNKIQSQNLAIWKYLNWELGNPLKDAKWLMKRFYELIHKLNFSYIKNYIQNIKLGEDFAKFVVVRHGEKWWDGNLTEHWINQATEAGKKIKELHSDLMPTWYFAVQQPINQMIMMALLAGQKDISLSTISNLSLDIWENDMPVEWQAPYETAEATTYTLSLSLDFDTQAFKVFDNNKKNNYLTEKMIITIERRGVKEQFFLSAIDKYLSLV
jgi:hypothetical protein